ncbi:iron ABC transporter substrate-binding protein [Variibacter gotjawalensis]|uniref:iron ABC transporter substrate-binding protein n=1 Tax=Variibacter gotjawalensis TaxID=1333996 RepID=UPI001DBDA3EF|nr:iron ABC transporter substrate-binding protein [Variibacter gotjawalensis]NIK50115.1 iron complex transport system substrate-binding protein [Variibacter gotjawalensis]
MPIDRRGFLETAALALLSQATTPAFARDAHIADGAGRRVGVPAKVQRVLPAGPPAAILLYTAAPDVLIGWTRTPRPDEKAYLLPDAADKPEVGRITGRGNTANLEVVLSHKPDMIIDAGSTTQTYVELADRVQAQTNIPYALLDGKFDAIVATYRTLGQLIDREERCNKLATWCEQTMRTLRSRIDPIAADKRPRVYYARGPRGLETGLAGSINVETIDFLGATNVARGAPGGLAQVSLEQVLVWNPEVIVTLDKAFAESVLNDPAWASVDAVKARRVYLSPRLPFGWVDSPPSVNRMAGLWWLAKLLYPTLFPEDIGALTREFYALFYQVNLSDADVAKIMSG